VSNATDASSIFDAPIGTEDYLNHGKQLKKTTSSMHLSVGTLQSSIRCFDTLSHRPIHRMERFFSL